MRRLVQEELNALKDEFIAYLIMQGIDAQEWNKIQKEDLDRANQFIDQFSFAYFEVMLTGIKYVTLSTSDSVHTLHFRSKDIHHFLIKRQDQTQVAQKEEEYFQDRLKTIFDYLEKGYQPDKGEAYKELALLYAEGKM